MNHAERLAGLEATAIDMERLGQPQRARMIRQVLVPYYNWLESELQLGFKPRQTSDTIARGLGNAIEFFVALTGGNRTRQYEQVKALLNMVAIETIEQHADRQEGLEE